MSDPLMRLLEELPAAHLDATRDERLRSQCRDRLLRNVSRASSGATTTLTPVWKVLVGVLGVAYFVGAIVEALRAYRLS